MLSLINEAAARFNQHCNPEHRLTLPLSSAFDFLGPESPLDSLALTTFVLEIELLLEERGAGVSLTNAEALGHMGDIGSLASFLEGKCSRS